MSAARDQEWFCEGIAEEILNALTKLPGLKVATRTSAFRFKGPARDLGNIGAARGVTTLLEGSVRTAGSRLRVTAQLVNASDGYQLWSERFEGEMGDVFEIQDTIAEQTVKALEVRLVTAPGAPGQVRHSNDLEAYQLYLKGRHLRYTRFDLRAALRCFEAAVKRDPAHILARIALAETLVIMSIYGMLLPSLGHARAKTELRQARELGRESPQVAAIQGLLALICDWDTSASLESLERALALDTSCVTCRVWYGVALIAGEKPKEALRQARQLITLDPESPYAITMAGYIRIMAGRAEEAVAFERRALELEPHSPHATWMLGLALAAGAEWEEALEWFGRAVTLSSRTPFYVGLLAWCQAASGRRAEAQQVLAELERRSATEYVSPLFLAWGYSELDDTEKTQRLLREALMERVGIITHLNIPAFRQLRRLPPMVELRQRLRGGADAGL
jgi:TolB-like protein/Flp pilus assembly protein TadD